MYKLYDLDMNEIPFPEGVMPLDFLVGAISKTRETEDIPGRHGVMSYGFNYNSRPVTINMLLTANDRIDFQLLRNEIYALFNIHDEFYIADNLLPSRVLKVAVDESYSPEKFNHTDAEVTINCRTLDSLFWESKYTTLELHDSGYSATAEKYGLVDNIDDEKVRYRFTPETDYQPNLISLTQSVWEEGGWFTTTGGANDRSGRIRTKAQSPIEVIEGRAYTFRDESVYTSAINNIYILHYRDGQYIGSSRGWELVRRSGSLTFNARGNEIRLSLLAMDGFGILLEFITNGRIQMKLEPGEEHTGFIPDSSRFSVYNAGNVTVEPESMQISFNFTGVYTTGGFTIRNLTTGEEVILNRSSGGSHFRMDGMLFSLGAINNVFRDTNRRFISLSPGDNQFEIVGGTFSQCWFDFKYYYK